MRALTLDDAKAVSSFQVPAPHSRNLKLETRNMNNLVLFRHSSGQIYGRQQHENIRLKKRYKNVQRKKRHR